MSSYPVDHNLSGRSQFVIEEEGMFLGTHTGAVTGTSTGTTDNLAILQISFGPGEQHVCFSTKSEQMKTYRSSTRGPEDDSVQSKHVAPLSHYMFNFTAVVLTELHPLLWKRKFSAARNYFVTHQFIS
jgi:hypothetical protein